MKNPKKGLVLDQEIVLSTLKTNFGKDFQYNEETNCYEEILPPVVHKFGNVYDLYRSTTYNHCLAILSQVGAYAMALISLSETSNRWNDPVHFSSFNNISDKEFIQCLGSLSIENVKYVGQIQDLIKIPETE